MRVAPYPPATDAASPDLVVRFDGAASPNPGPAAYAVVIESPEGAKLHTFASDIGFATNNVAEWQGCIAALKAARNRGARRPMIVGDSRLVIEQASGRWKVKKSHLRPYVAEALAMLAEFEQVTFRWNPRELNTVADELAGQALDFEAMP